MTDASPAALLVIDAQESFRARQDEWERTANPRVLAHVARLVDRFRAAGEPVLWILHAEPGSGGVFDPAQGFVRVIEDLAPASTETQLTKTTINAFGSTDLQQRLVAAGVRTVVVCGIRTEQCCETTARVASDLGFDVEFVTDATTTSTIAATESYGEVTGDELMRRTESVLGARGFATITTTDRVVGG